MLKRLGSAVLGPAALLALAGCQTLASGPPRNIPPVDQAHLFPPDPSRTVLAAQDWTKYDTPEKKIEARNEYVTARMNFIDRAFHDYEQNFLQDIRSSGFLMDFVIASLGIGAAAIRDTQIVRGLTTAGAVATAGRTTFDKEVLMDRTLPTLLNQMRANRADVKAKILDRLRLGYAQYPIGLAQSDVDEYYQAGTLISALTAAADSATTRKISEEANADRAITGTYQKDLYTGALRAYLDVDDDTEFARRNAVFKAQLATVYVTQDPAEFTDMTEDLRLKKQILDALIAAETDPQVKQQLIDLRETARKEG
jgi:hypothetical protein